MQEEKPLNKILLKEMIDCVKREVGLRYSVYQKLIESGKMQREKAKREQELMYLVQKTLQKIYDGDAPQAIQKRLFE